MDTVVALKQFFEEKKIVEEELDRKQKIIEEKHLRFLFNNGKIRVTDVCGGSSKIENGCEYYTYAGYNRNIDGLEVFVRPVTIELTEHVILKVVPHGAVHLITKYGKQTDNDYIDLLNRLGFSRK